MALRGLGHTLKPVVQIGRGGIDDALVAALDQALTDHELVKLKILEAAGELREDRDATAEALAARTNSEVAQVLGGMVLLYRAHPLTPTINLSGKGPLVTPKPAPVVRPPPKPPKPLNRKARAALGTRRKP